MNINSGKEVPFGHAGRQVGVKSVFMQIIFRIFFTFGVMAFVIGIPTLSGSNTDRAFFPKPIQTDPGEEIERPVHRNFGLPPTLPLCGERMPLENRHVWEMLDREFTIVAWSHAQVFLWLKRAGRYFPYIEKKLAEAGMPEDLKYLAVAESDLLPHAKSPAGARGTWQFMAPTARRHGLRKDRKMDERRDFAQATSAALKYLKKLKAQFGTWTLAMAAYNCGENRLAKEIEAQAISDYYRLNLPLETERYIFRIAAIKIIMANPARFGYQLDPEHIYQPLEFDSIEVNLPSPVHMTDVACALGTDFKVIKELNLHIKGNHLPSGRYTIHTPRGSGSDLHAVLKRLTRSSSSWRSTRQAARHHVVRPGDTLSRIARLSGVPMTRLKQLNGLSGPLIMVGQKLLLEP